MNSDRWFYNYGRGARIVGNGAPYSVKFDKEHGREDYTTNDFDAAFADVKDYIDNAVGTVVQVLLENGNNWVTTINTDYRGALDYYYGAGSFEQSDGSMSAVVTVSQLNQVGSIVEVVTREEYHKKIGKVFRNYV